jgi:hypothetical protein
LPKYITLDNSANCSTNINGSNVLVNPCLDIGWTLDSDYSTTECESGSPLWFQVMITIINNNCRLMDLNVEQGSIVKEM